MEKSSESVGVLRREVNPFWRGEMSPAIFSFGDSPQLRWARDIQERLHLFMILIKHGIKISSANVIFRYLLKILQAAVSFIFKAICYFK